MDAPSYGRLASHARLNDPLTALLQWARNPAGTPVSVPLAETDEASVEAPVCEAAPIRLDRVANRAKRMLKLLEANGFVSFG